MTVTWCVLMLPWLSFVVSLTVKVDIQMVPIVQVGDSVQMECVFRLGANYTSSNSMGVWWMHKQLAKYSPVSPDSASKDGVVTKTLTIESVSLSDAGEYTCQFDVIGTSTRGSSTAQLQVVAEGGCDVTQCLPHAVLVHV